MAAIDDFCYEWCEPRDYATEYLSHIKKIEEIINSHKSIINITDITEDIITYDKAFSKEEELLKNSTYEESLVNMYEIFMRDLCFIMSYNEDKDYSNVTCIIMSEDILCHAKDIKNVILNNLYNKFLNYFPNNISY